MRTTFFHIGLIWSGGYSTFRLMWTAHVYGRFIRVRFLMTHKAHCLASRM